MSVTVIVRWALFAPKSVTEDFIRKSTPMALFQPLSSLPVLATPPRLIVAVGLGEQVEGYKAVMRNSSIFDNFAETRELCSSYTVEPFKTPQLHPNPSVQ